MQKVENGYSLVFNHISCRSRRLHCFVTYIEKGLFEIQIQLSCKLDTANSSHHLGKRCHLSHLILILSVQNLSLLCIDDDIGLARDIRRGLHIWNKVIIDKECLLLILIHLRVGLPELKLGLHGLHLGDLELFLLVLINDAFGSLLRTLVHQWLILDELMQLVLLLT